MENLCYFLAFFASILLVKYVLCGSKSLPPSPLSLPIIGHLHLVKQPLHRSLENLLKKYGPILYLQLGYRSALVLSSPSAVEECFTRNDIVLANRPPSLVADHTTYDYTTFVFAPHGDLWKKLRRFTVAEMLSNNSLQKSSFVRVEEVRSILRLVSKVSNTKAVDLHHFFMLLSFNINMRLAAGKKCVEDEEACTDSGKQYLLELKETFVPVMSMDLCEFFPALRLLGYKGVENTWIDLHRKRDKFLQDLVEEIRLKIKVSPSGIADRTVIESLLSLQKSQPNFYSDDIIKGIILIMFIAGTDTTALTMEWVMSLLLNHPEELKKVKAEIDTQAGYSRLLEESDITKLPYLRCVVNETLRLYPAVPLLLPHCPSDDISVSGYKVEKDTILMVNAWAMHRDPNVWEEPEIFKPERFKGFEGERDGSKFIPFGMGRRACPGGAMAMRTIMLALGSLIHCFDWGRVGEEMLDMDQRDGLTLARVRPLVAACTPRESMITLFS
ncbi:hypothetical protein K2173_007923 [Erythroxylum novogranatense]|uniref:Cytochrome P450 n=1 Tax=Erythroxylum novogranatense TaxID=1862640 RepID=A0AAV8T828_9ROSI|nr:hypothetical protein K2173_007923 [Erythroxylum novogranatense]